MRIIYISKNNYHIDIIRNNLQQLSEQDSIAFFYSYDEAEYFINNYVVKKQIQLDLIITENNIQNQRAIDFFQRITCDKRRFFSNGDFNFCSIPIVLIVDEGENKSAFSYYGFSDVIQNIGHNRLHLFIPELKSCVISWRKKVLDELDNLGIKFNSGKIDYSYILSRDKKRNVETIVLSENFKLFPRKLSYDWLNFNEREIEMAIDKYVKELKRANRLNKKKDEKRFHKIFNEYPFFIKRDNYSKHWYEPRLYYEENNYFEPDYTLLPNFNQRTELSILEVKLPNEGFIKKTKFHPKPYSAMLDHIFQVNDYKEYLESEEYQDMIKKAFGFVPAKLEYNILMGRIDDKNDSLKVLNKRLKEMNATDINFVTYDELLDYQVKYLERMKFLSIV